MVASPSFLSEVDREGIVCLSTPLKVNELISTVGMMCQTQERIREQEDGRSPESGMRRTRR